MASPATDRLVKAEIRFTWNGQLVENVLHFVHTIDPPDPTNMGMLADFIRDQVQDFWLAQMASTVTFREVYVEEYAGNISQSATSVGTGNGTLAGESMPGNATFCLSLRTEFVGRSRRGRFYTIGMSENNQSAGVVNAVYRNAWLGLLSNIRVLAALDNWGLCVASFTSGGSPRPTAQVTLVNAIIAVDDFVDSQRRRLQGRGS